MSKSQHGGRSAAQHANPRIAGMFASMDLQERLAERAGTDWLKVEKDWMNKCAIVEGSESFRAWYEDDTNIPAYGKASDRVLLLQAHHEALKSTHAAEFYWLKVEDQEAENCIEIEGRAGFSEWWNSVAFPASPKERVDLIRARIATFLQSDGTTQVQARVREIQQALIEKKAKNISEVRHELADLQNHLQSAGVEISGEKGGDDATNLCGAG